MGGGGNYVSVMLGMVKKNPNLTWQKIFVTELYLMSSGILSSS